MLKKRLCFCFLLIGLFVFSATGSAKVYRVGVTPIPPFAYYHNGQYSGFAIDLWRQIAQTQHIKYKFVLLKNEHVGQSLNEVSRHKLDTAIGPTVVTFTAVKKMNFSRPYFINKLMFITLQRSSFWQTLVSIVKPFFQHLVVIYFLLLFIFALISWLSGRHNEPGHKTFWAALYNKIITLISLGLLNEPITKLGKFLVVVWLMISATFVAVFGAVVTSAMTISSSSLRLNNQLSVAMIRNKVVAVRRDSYGEFVAQLLKISYVTVNSFRQGIEQVKEGNVDGFLANSITVKYHFMTAKDVEFNKQHYQESPVKISEVAFPVAKRDTQLLNQINVTLTQMQDSNQVVQICQQYMDLHDSWLCMI